LALPSAVREYKALRCPRHFYGHSARAYVRISCTAPRLDIASGEFSGPTCSSTFRGSTYSALSPVAPYVEQGECIMSRETLLTLFFSRLFARPVIELIAARAQYRVVQHSGLSPQ
jgi:hypothetical protein